MMLGAWLGALLWGAFTSTLFLWQLQCGAQRLALQGRRESIVRLIRPVLVAGLVFAPALVDGPLVMASLLGFAVGRTALLALFVGRKHTRGSTS